MGDISHIKNIAVIGAGIQGHAITQIALMAGFDKVFLNDLTMETIEKGVSLIKNNPRLGLKPILSLKQCQK